jgi:predicted DNA-binding transcriptional regulator AlpA
MMQLLSPKQTCDRLGIGRTTLWRLTRNGGFPQTITLTTGAKGCAGRKAFVAAEIDQWIAAQIAKRDTVAA